jgi:hypothetical protein
MSWSRIKDVVQMRHIINYFISACLLIDSSLTVCRPTIALIFTGTSSITLMLLRRATSYATLIILTSFSLRVFFLQQQQQQQHTNNIIIKLQQ